MRQSGLSSSRKGEEEEGKKTVRDLLISIQNVGNRSKCPDLALGPI